MLSAKGGTRSLDYSSYDSGSGLWLRCLGLTGRCAVWGDSTTKIYFALKPFLQRAFWNPKP